MQAMISATCYMQITESFEAGAAAASKVLEQLGSVVPDFIFLFVTVGHEIPAVIEGVQSVLPTVPLCGCSGGGVITNDGCDESSHSLGLLAIQAEKLKFHPFIVPGLADRPEKVGCDIAKRINAVARGSAEKDLLFLFTDGITINFDALYRGLQQELKTPLDIVGGAAGNDFRNNVTFQFYNGEVITDGAAGVLITGEFDYRLGITHGSIPVGLFRQITRAEKNVILEIDNMPALDLLEDFIGEDRVNDIGHVLNLFELGEEFEGRGYEGDVLNRAIIGVDSERRGIRLAVEIPEGSRIKITRRDPSLVLSRTKQKTQDLVNNMKHPGEAVYFYFNCSGRGAYLFGETEPDVDAFRGELGTGKNMLGFFTFGEFAPIQGENYYHNYTGVIVGIESTRSDRT